MKRWSACLLPLMLAIACSSISKRDPGNISRYPAELKPYPAKDSLSLPAFFDSLYAHHAADYTRLRGGEVKAQLQSVSIHASESALLKLKFFHELFTSSDASNGSRKGALSIPYFWHWVNPNPRHEIRLASTQTLLKEKSPPQGYGLYQSAADPDRLPDLFLGDLANPEPQYSHPRFGTFSSFGWCSEREMSFVLLMEGMGYKGKIIASGNHCWSEFLMTNGADFITIRVDNTFDGFELQKMTAKERLGWENQIGEGKLPAWYNQKAKDVLQKKKVKAIKVPKKAADRMASEAAKYLMGEF